MGKPRLKDILSCLILKLNNFAFWFWGENSKKNNLVFFLKVAHYQSHNPLFLFIVYNFSYFYQTIFFRWRDSERGSLMPEATAQPTVPLSYSQKVFLLQVLGPKN